MPRRSFLFTPRHTPLEDQIRTCINCGTPFTPVFDAQEQCCIEGFERKEVAGDSPLPRPTAYEEALRRKQKLPHLTEPEVTLDLDEIRRMNTPGQILSFIKSLKREG